MPESVRRNRTRVNPLAEDLDHILAHTSRVWDAVRGENVFITGGTGFFGRWLVESFAHANQQLRLNARMVVLSRDPHRFQVAAPHLGAAAGIDFVSGDVRSFNAAAVRTQLGTSKPSRYLFVIHAATEASARLNAENPLLMIDTIVEGTRAALEFAVQSGTKRFLFTSSGAIYGRQPSEMTHIPEDYTGGPDPTDPNCAYGEAKRLAELLCACYYRQHGIEPVIARCFALVGPFLPLDAHFAIGNFIRDALCGAPIQVNGDGTPRRSYLYAADLAIWLWTMLVQAPTIRPYNVGSEEDISIEELAHQIGKHVSGLAEVRVAQKPVQIRNPARYIPSTARAHAELELRQWISLPEGIDRTMVWLRSQQTG